MKGSSISREVDDVLYLHAGPEIGVASTKAYMGMLVAFELLALWLGQERGTLSEDDAREVVAALRDAPELIEQALAYRPCIAEVAETYKGRSDYLFLGRGINFPTALEGALKLKEISYIHAEAYATGEMKHGPIALIDEDMPVVAVATRSALYAKTLSNLQEVKARDGELIALANPGDELVASNADVVIPVPETHELVSPLVNVVAMQLLAYETANPARPRRGPAAEPGEERDGRVGTDLGCKVSRVRWPAGRSRRPHVCWASVWSPATGCPDSGG